MAKKDSSKKKLDSQKLAQELEEVKAGWQRTQADFANAQRHWQEEKEKIHSLVTIATLLELAPVLDNFQRAFATLPENNSWAQGFRQIEKQILEVFKKHGLEKMQTLGETFDPAKHEAISQIAHSKPSGTIIEELEAGYLFQNKVVKPARVIISKGGK